MGGKPDGKNKASKKAPKAVRGKAKISNAEIRAAIRRGLTDELRELIKERNR